MTPALSYSVPARGWRNYEDYPGGFLLVPPRNSLAGVNAERSDFIGIGRSIAAARFTAPPRCDVEPVPGVANTPTAIATWIRRQPQLVVRGPYPAAVGGLRGLRIDIRVKPGASLTTVHCSDDGVSFTGVLLYEGLAPTDTAQGVTAHTTVRLYLLRYRGGTLSVHAADKQAAPGTVRSLTAVIDRFRFSP